MSCDKIKEVLYLFSQFHTKARNFFDLPWISVKNGSEGNIVMKIPHDLLPPMSLIQKAYYLEKRQDIKEAYSTFHKLFCQTFFADHPNIPFQVNVSIDQIKIDIFNSDALLRFNSGGDNKDISLYKTNFLSKPKANNLITIEDSLHHLYREIVEKNPLEGDEDIWSIWSGRGYDKVLNVPGKDAEHAIFIYLVFCILSNPPPDFEKINVCKARDSISYAEYAKKYINRY